MEGFWIKVDFLYDGRWYEGQSVKLTWSTCILRPTPLKEKNGGRKCTCVLRASFV